MIYQQQYLRLQMKSISKYELSRLLFQLIEPRFSHLIMLNNCVSNIIQNQNVKITIAILID